MKAQPLLAPVLIALVLAACGKEQPESQQAATQEQAAPAAAVEATPAPAAENGVVESGYDVYTARCIACHGDVGQGVGDNPKLAGLGRADVSSRLRDYRDGKTLGPKTAVMATAARDLTDKQIDDLAGYVGE